MCGVIIFYFSGFLIILCACVPLPNPNLKILGTVRPLHALYPLNIQRRAIINSNKAETDIRISLWLIPLRGSRLEVRVSFFFFAEDELGFIGLATAGST